MKYNTAIHDIMCTLCYSFIDCDLLQIYYVFLQQKFSLLKWMRHTETLAV